MRDHLKRDFRIFMLARIPSQNWPGEIKVEARRIIELRAHKTTPIIQQQHESAYGKLQNKVALIAHRPASQ